MLAGASESGASGGGAAGFDGVIKEVQPVKLSAYTKDRFIQECALSLFANTHFDNGANVVRAASEAVNKAKILASQLTFEE
jgi:hypothetical protein